MVLYHSEDGTVSVNAYIKEDLWITQKAMAELFGVDKSGISRHLKNIFNTGELDERVVVAKIATTTQHGAMDGKTQTSETKFYNLDAIISVGYRVNSKKATQFRIWAPQILKEYMKKCFVLDDERLKQGKLLLEKTISKSFLKEYVPSVQVSAEYGSRLQTYLRNAVLIMQKIPKLPTIFLLQYRISSIMP